MFGVSTEGDIFGQDVADGILRDLAMMTAKVEPPVQVVLRSYKLGVESGRLPERAWQSMTIGLRSVTTG